MAKAKRSGKSGKKTVPPITIRVRALHEPGPPPPNVIANLPGSACTRCPAVGSVVKYRGGSGALGAVINTKAPGLCLVKWQVAAPSRWFHFTSLELVQAPVSAAAADVDA